MNHTQPFQPVDETAILAADEAAWNAMFPPLTEEQIIAAMEERTLPASPKEKAPKKPYDRGTPQGCKQIGPGTYEVSSFRNPEAAPYTVDLNAGTCDCPHFKKRLAETGDTCKHIDHATEEARLLSLVKALAIPFEQLEAQAQREDLRPEVQDAIQKALRTRVMIQSGYARV